MRQAILNKYGKPRFLEEIDEDTICIYGESSSVTIERNKENNEIVSIEYENGPRIIVGEEISRSIITEIIKDEEDYNKPNSFLIKGEKIQDAVESKA